MIDNETILFDRLQKIRQVISKYGEENFYLSFSGGKDSTVLSALIDMALPGNKIPRVFANTGIEYKKIVDFVGAMAEHDNRVIIINPSVPIKPMLEQEGYPFKSKEHSAVVDYYQRGGRGAWLNRYLTRGDRFGCPDKLRYQFTEDCHIRISDKCCDRLKKDTLHRYQKENSKPYGIVAIMASEGGRRTSANCLAFQGDKLKNFQPFVPVSLEWVDWCVSQYNIEICELYKPPYNFKRTGCKGCPFAAGNNLQHELDILEKFFPEERKQCEIIWKPVYEEYRRLGYRLKPYKQMSIEDYMKGDTA